MRSRRLSVVGCALVMLSAVVTLVQAVGDGSGDEEQERISLSMEVVRQVNDPLLADEGRVPVILSLQECIHRAMLHNLDLKIEAHAPAIRLSDVVQAEAAFDAVLFGSAEYASQDRANMESSADERDTLTDQGQWVTTRFPTDPFDTSHDYKYSMGVQRRLATGATVAIAESLRRYKNTVSADDELLYYNPFYQYSLELSLNQPQSQ